MQPCARLLAGRPLGWSTHGHTRHGGSWLDFQPGLHARLSGLVRFEMVGRAVAALAAGLMPTARTLPVAATAGSAPPPAIRQPPVAHPRTGFALQWLCPGAGVLKEHLTCCVGVQRAWLCRHLERTQGLAGSCVAGGRVGGAVTSFTGFTGAASDRRDRSNYCTQTSLPRINATIWLQL